MIFLSQNLRGLRKNQNLSQQALANKLHISRASLAKYEGGINEPSLELTLRISRYFNISIDVFLTVDLSKMEYLRMGKSNLGIQNMIVPIQVDAAGENVIEIVSHSASAGYTGAYSDPGFIETLDQMALPFQELHGKCRAFPIEGDSMPPFGHGCYVIGRHVDSRSEIEDKKRYIIVSRDEGIVFKRVVWDRENDGVLILNSDNPKYKNFSMPLHEIVEVWEFVAAISFPKSSDNYYENEVLMRFKELQDDIQKLATDLLPNNL